MHLLVDDPHKPVSGLSGLRDLNQALQRGLPYREDWIHQHSNQDRL